MHINQGKHKRPSGPMGHEQALSLRKLRDQLFDLSKEAAHRVPIKDALDMAYFVGMLRVILDQNRCNFTDNYVGAIISMENLVRKYAQ